MRKVSEPKGLKRVVEFCDGLILVGADGGESLARTRVALREHADAAAALIPKFA